MKQQYRFVVEHFIQLTVICNAVDDLLLRYLYIHIQYMHAFMSQHILTTYILSFHVFHIFYAKFRTNSTDEIIMARSETTRSFIIA